MNVRMEGIEEIKYIDEDCGDIKDNSLILDKKNFKKKYDDKINHLYFIFKRYERTGFDEIDADDVRRALMDMKFVETLTNTFSHTAPSMLMERVIRSDKPLTFEEFCEIVLKSKRISYEIAQYKSIKSCLYNDKLSDKRNLIKEEMNFNVWNHNEILNACLFLFFYSAIMIITYEVDKYTKFKYVSYYGELQYYDFSPTMFLTYIFIHKSRTTLLYNLIHFSCIFITLEYYFKMQIKYIVIVITSAVTYGAVIHLFDETNLSGSVNCIIALETLFFINILFNEKKRYDSSILPIILCIIYVIPIISHPSSSAVGAFMGGFFSSILIILKAKLIYLPCHGNSVSHV
uniref:Rhomboid domain-containing protein n=1 Tax=Parastrongyloides trichosuri TaxID=131310 RepID=A0A0N5A437_PARTI